MMEFLAFTFSSFWTFIGMMILLGLTAQVMMVFIAALAAAVMAPFTRRRSDD